MDQAMNRELTPLISIVTATYNSSEFITETYNSILAQDHTNWEWVITDDASQDHTFDVLLELAEKDKRVKVYKLETNSGAAIARNHSLRKLEGEYVAFIDSDDLWFSSKLRLQLNFMRSKNIKFSFTQYKVFDESGEDMEKVVDQHESGFSVTYEDMLKKKATLGCSTVMLKKDSFKDIFMPELRTGQDYALWLKLLRTGCAAHLLREPLTAYRVRQGSISRNKIKKAKRQWQIYREIEKLSLLKSVYCMSFYAFRAVFRK